MEKIFFLLLMLASLPVLAQNESNNRYIEVTGSSKMEIEPDEIVIAITIEEYWKEEFEKKKEFEDYKNKVSLSQIEDELIKSLRKAGIDKKSIVVKNMGNYWRYRGKEFLFSKQLEVDVTDLSKINKLMQLADAKGIKSMRIAELKNANMGKFKREVKIQALQNAKEKAKYLVESIGSELGEVQTITEVSDSYPQPVMARSMAMLAESTPESIDQIQNITLTYQVRARFGIN